MIHLYITRHGETIENAGKILQGHLPGHLSPLGISQAEMLCLQLVDIRFDCMIASTLQRAIDTAHILNRPHHLPVYTTDLLRERDWGSFTGKRIADIRVQPADFPADVENPEQLQRRAHAFLEYLLKNFDGQTVLAVGHGYFNRCILAEFYGTTPHDIPRWGNTEVRTILLDRLRTSSASASDSGASAD